MRFLSSFCLVITIMLLGCSANAKKEDIVIDGSSVTLYRASIKEMKTYVSGADEERFNKGYVRIFNSRWNAFYPDRQHLGVLFLAIFDSGNSDDPEEVMRVMDGVSLNEILDYYDKSENEEKVRVQEEELRRKYLSDGIFSQERCNEGEALGCHYHGYHLMFGRGGMKQDVSRGENKLQYACDAGEFSACSTLGVAYTKGEVLNKNVSKANQIFENACNKGDSHNCALLGKNLVEGAGGIKDLSKGRNLLESGCKQGNRNACLFLDEL